MSGYILSPAARRDLSEIWDYTAETWGTEQANRYVLGIRDACDALAGGKRSGRSADSVRPGYRKLAVGSHLLFFRVSGTGVIDVVRILHKRMDVSTHIR